ncbi:MAG: hypothetical protein AAGD17_02230 [Bacteroidota bacterium]
MKGKRKVYHGFAKLDEESTSYQFCDIMLDEEEMIISLHTPIVL